MTLEDLNLNDQTDQTDIKPNFILSIIIILLLSTDIFFFILNEVDILHANKIIMRICFLVSIALGIVPIVFGLNKKLAAKKYSKFISMGFVVIICFIDFCLLHIHAYLLCIGPLIFSTQYKNLNVTRIAILGSIITVIVAPIVGILSGLWSNDNFFVYLAGTVNKTKYIKDGVTELSNSEVTIRTFLYFVMPILMITLAYSVIFYFVSKANVKALNTQIKYLLVSKTDSLTGLFNQSCYQQVISEINEDGKIGVIFLDVNKLKETNDKHGHEFGDLLLKRCGDILKNLIDDHTYCFRIGGDEFLILSKSEDEEIVNKIIKKLENSIYNINLENKTLYPLINCDLAYGSSYGNINDIQKLIHDADENMYISKKKNISNR